MLVRPYGTMPDGTPVEVLTLGDDAGLRVEIITYGGAVIAIEAPDRSGARENVVLSLPSLADYIGHRAFFGALIGRYANRIGGAAFDLDGRRYRVSANEGENCLHGGRVGFDKAVWTVVESADAPEPRLTLRHVSADGDQGFPGEVALDVTYTVSGSTLRIDYRATTDRPTVVNFTNHAYFNLGAPDILAHEVTIAANAFTPVDAQLIPTGEIRNVAGTPFDFRAPQAIGARIGAADEQLARGLGYDHNFVLDGNGGLRFAARVREPASGRVLEVFTTQPGIQFYSGNQLDGSLRGPNGEVWRRHAGFCLETQHFPDSPNKPAFPTTVLRLGEAFVSTTEYRFSAE